MVEVANDEAFTTNAINSGWMGGVTSGAGGTATWALPAANWNTLKAGEAIFYRVTTKDANGANIRQSWHPGNNICLTVPVGKAALNGSGTKDCSCSAAGGSSRSAMALMPVFIIAAMIGYRRRFRKNDLKNGNEAKDR
jgi:MYXO-CTERM domain-containing protein